MNATEAYASELVVHTGSPFQKGQEAVGSIAPEGSVALSIPRVSIVISVLATGLGILLDRRAFGLVLLIYPSIVKVTGGIGRAATRLFDVYVAILLRESLSSSRRVDMVSGLERSIPVNILP